MTDSKELQFQQDWNEIKRILNETGTSDFDIADRVVRLMDAIDARDLSPIVKILQKKEEIFLNAYK